MTEILITFMGSLTTDSGWHKERRKRGRREQRTRKGGGWSNNNNGHNKLIRNRLQGTIHIRVRVTWMGSLITSFTTHLTSWELGLKRDMDLCRGRVQGLGTLSMEVTSWMKTNSWGTSSDPSVLEPYFRMIGFLEWVAFSAASTLTTLQPISRKTLDQDQLSMKRFFEELWKCQLLDKRNIRNRHEKMPYNDCH